MFNIRGWEWIIILALVLLIFGPTKLPGLARSVGKAVTEFRTGVRKAQDDLKGLAGEVNPLADPPPEPKTETPKAAPEAKPEPVVEVKEEVVLEKMEGDNGVPPEPDYPEDA